MAPHPSGFPIDAWQGGLSGLFTVNQLRSVPPAQRSFRRVFEVAWPLDRVPIVRPEQPAVEVASLMAQAPSGRALMMDGERLLGIISRSDLTTMGEKRSRLGDAGGQRGILDRPAGRPR